MDNPTADQLRTRLVEIADEIRELPEAVEAAREWAERAGRKGTHDPHPDVLKARVRAHIAGSGSGIG